MPGDPPVTVNHNADIIADQIPALFDGAEIVIIDYTPLPTDVALHRAEACSASRHRCAAR